MKRRHNKATDIGTDSEQIEEAYKENHTTHICMFAQTNKIQLLMMIFCFLLLVLVIVAFVVVDVVVVIMKLYSFLF